jgi:hypothetical protein
MRALPAPDEMAQPIDGASAAQRLRSRSPLTRRPACWWQVALPFVEQDPEDTPSVRRFAPDQGHSQIRRTEASFGLNDELFVVEGVGEAAEAVG